MNYTSPEIDKCAGIDYYSTSFSGTGGTIKKSNEDFEVKELISTDFLNKITPTSTIKNKIPLYEISKKGLDSNHAIILLRKRLGINFKIIGIKDAKATTSQYGSTLYSKKIYKNYSVDNIKITLLGYSQKPIEKSILIGNQFKINITHPNLKDEKRIKRIFSSELINIANYYGLQRFGSERLVTHLVGKSILQRKFDKAVDLLLTYTTKYDTKYSKEIRQKLRDLKNRPENIKLIPRGMDLEKNIANEIIKGKESISVLRAVPLSIRRLFVQAFQAFIFNKTLSKFIELEIDLLKCEKDDLCFEVLDNFTFGKIKKFQNQDTLDIKYIPIIRLPGYSFQPGKNRFDLILKNILNDEGISAKDFYIKEMQELSESGGFRPPGLLFKDFKYEINKDSIVVEFSIPKGSYATTLLREIIKPKDPISSGF